ncbi:MAG: hypothetical protein IKH01_08490 [Prevotella sp.]|nr:hypothetical protein [Prevotella sp.]MBR3079839.1 hypothetical protein [Prevotella sp.]
MKHRGFPGLLLGMALFVLPASLLTSCQTEGEYSVWPCRFDYNNMIHQDPTLATAMNAASRGVFCKIWDSGMYFSFQNNQNMSSQQTKTEEERRANFVLGVNNGIIVGYQTFNTSPNGGFVAYDAQCPNCVRKADNYVNPKFPLTMSTSGIATCGKCGKKYDMNNGGIIQNGEEGDVGLEKYLASSTEPLGFLSVGTKR